MNEKTKIAVTELNVLLKEAFADNLLTLVLYGSAAGTAYNKDLSDINVLVILERESADKIFKFGQAAKSLIRKNRISLIIMTREEFTTAADVFPLEYSDIMEEHAVIYGNNDILNIKIDEKNLRLELEEKLRGSVADIRRMLMAAGGNEKPFQKLILHWSSLGAALFRGLLRLKGKNVAGLDAESVAAQVESEYKVSLEGFSVLNRLRQNKKFRPLTALGLTEMLLAPLASLIKTVDAMDKGAK
jgi:predicted nucleotidyltransferase